MHKRTIRILSLCLVLLCFFAIAKSEGTSSLIAADPVIVYDGTILNIFIECTPMADETALVDLYQLDQDMLDNREAKEALEKGWKLLGIQSDVEVFSGDIVYTGRVFSERYNGPSMTKGFHYMLAPSFPRENLTFSATTALFETYDGPELDSFQFQQSIPDAIAAQTASIPADIHIGSAHVDEVFVSSSEEALCVLLHFDSEVSFSLPDSGFPRELPFTVSYTDPSTDETEAIMELYSLPVYLPTESTPWWVFVFDPVQQMPDQLLLTLEDMAWIEETVSLVIDMQQNGVTAL